VLVRRPATGLLANLWGLPGGELRDGHGAESQLRTHVKESTDAEVQVGPKLATVQHEFTHRRWRVQVYAAALLRPLRSKGQPHVRWVAPSELAEYPLAALDRKLLRAARLKSQT
jgi:adenine-specific DNA glycosylase